MRKRLLVAATLTLISFLGLAGVALDRAFVSSTRVTVKNQLKSQVNALLTLMDINASGDLVFPESMPETRLISPNSGLYAFILNHQGEVIWRSSSSVGIRLTMFYRFLPAWSLFTSSVASWRHLFTTDLALSGNTIRAGFSSFP